jgi:RHS repeat-associated protein
VSSVTYDAAGERTRLGYPNGTQTSYSYDARGHVTNVSAVSGPTTVASFGYTLDPAGKRTRIAEADGTNRVYGYDALERLTQETVTGALSYGKTFTYGVTGNRLTQVTTGAGAASVAYTYDLADHLKTENATSYTYDANGNVTSKGGEATYAWDFENRLVSVTMSDGTVVSHLYDVDGNRVKTTVAPSGGAGPVAVTNMLVDTSGGLSQVVAETDGAGALQAYYVRAGNELLAVMRPAAGGTWATRYVHQDALGSVRALTDEAGVLADTRGYEAFGTMNVEAGSDPLPYRFAGEPFDPTSKLAYHRARWMDSRVGRFEGADPLAGVPSRPATLHRYSYGSNDPVGRLDPSGQVDFSSFSAVVSIVSIGAAMGVVVPNHEVFVGTDHAFGPLTIVAVGDSEAKGASPVSGILEMTRYTGGTHLRVRMTDLASFASLSTGLSEPGQIVAIHFFDHGSCTPDGLCNFKFGSKTDSAAVMWNRMPELVELRERLAPGGFVQLHQCQAGQDRETMKGMARALGVRVIASTEANVELGSPSAGDTVGSDLFSGDLVTCRPDGSCESL